MDEFKEVESTLTLLQRFIPAAHKDKTFNINDFSGWERRATLVLYKGENQDIKRIEISNEATSDIAENLKIFEKHCAEGDKYQLAIKELGLFTTISPCAYVENGLQDAIIFNLTPTGNIYSFAYQKSYTKFKKIQKSWMTEGLVRKVEEGPRPSFLFKAYDEFGRQKVVSKEGKEKEEQEQPWYSKYWWAILIGVFLFMQMLSPPPEEGKEGEGAGGNAAANPRTGR